MAFSAEEAYRLAPKIRCEWARFRGRPVAVTVAVAVSDQVPPWNI